MSVPALGRLGREEQELYRALPTHVRPEGADNLDSEAPLVIVVTDRRVIAKWDELTPVASYLQQFRLRDIVETAMTSHDDRYYVRIMGESGSILTLSANKLDAEATFAAIENAILLLHHRSRFPHD
jgi:hypothetical protein